MTPEDTILFACIRPDFSAVQQEVILAVCRGRSVRWDVVYSTAEFQGVAPLVYANLKQCLGPDCNIPAAVTEQFVYAYFSNHLAKTKTAERLAEVLWYVNQHRIDTMLIKGAALDLLVYAHPWYTTANDVDLVFRPTRTEMTNSPVPAFLDHYQDIHFEYDYFEHHDVNMNGILPINFDAIWRDATKTDFRGQPVWVMSPEDLLLATCINSCRKRFFRLKSLRDIAEIVLHYPNLNWAELSTKARAYECNNIVYAALVVTQQMMGLELRARVLDGLAVPRVRAAIIRYLSRNLSLTSLEKLFSGNQLFGRQVGRGLLLPYATYPGSQLWKRTKFVSTPRFRRKPLSEIRS